MEIGKPVEVREVELAPEEAPREVPQETPQTETVPA